MWDEMFCELLTDRAKENLGVQQLSKRRAVLIIGKLEILRQFQYLKPDYTGIAYGTQLCPD